MMLMNGRKLLIILRHANGKPMATMLAFINSHQNSIARSFVKLPFRFKSVIISYYLTPAHIPHCSPCGLA